jgi:hypothetical protein
LSIGSQKHLLSKCYPNSFVEVDDGIDRHQPPQAQAQARKIHAYFEGEFIKANLLRSAVAAGVPPYGSCNCSIEQETRTVILASLAEVEPLYALEKEGSFKRGDPRGIAFGNARLAAGATELRDMIVNAWQDSAQTPVSYPMVNVRDIESGKVRVTRDLFGAD